MPSRCMVLLFAEVFFFDTLSTQRGDITQDSARTAVKEIIQKEFGRWQDSVKAVRIKDEVRRNGKPLNAFLEEMREKENVRKRQWYFRIGLGVAFLIAIAASLLRKRVKT